MPGLIYISSFSFSSFDSNFNKLSSQLNRLISDASRAAGYASIPTF